MRRFVSTAVIAFSLVVAATSAYSFVDDQKQGPPYEGGYTGLGGVFTHGRENKARELPTELAPNRMADQVPSTDRIYTGPKGYLSDRHRGGDGGYKEKNPFERNPRIDFHRQ